MSSNERKTILLDGRFCSLSQTEYEVFTLLILHKGEVLSREQLLRDVWGYQKGMTIATRSVDMCITRLREKIGTGRIQSVYGQGYRLIV